MNCLDISSFLLYEGQGALRAIQIISDTFLVYFRPPLPLSSCVICVNNTSGHPHPPMWRDKLFLKSWRPKIGLKCIQKQWKSHFFQKKVTWHFWKHPPPCVNWRHCREPPSQPPSQPLPPPHPKTKCHVLFEWPLKEKYPRWKNRTKRIETIFW